MRLLTRALKIVLMALGLYVAMQVLIRLFRRLFPFPVPSFMSPLLDSPLRDLSYPREETLERIGLKPDLRVLELGAGPGYLTIEAARKVGPDGHLTAVDIQPALIATLAEKVDRAGLTNVDLQVADVRNLPMPDSSYDLVFMAAVLGALPDKGRALREIRRVLKPNGRLSITEAMADADFMLQGEVVGWAQTVGFELVEQHGSAFLYTLNFRSMFEH